MATRSTIGIQNADGTVSYSCCHYDGYPENNGAILLQHYKTEDRVRHLLQYGDMSTLGKYITPSKYSSHTFENPEPDVCVFYHRDRGEPMEHRQRPEPFSKCIAQFCGYEYNYLFVNGKWMYMSCVDGEYKELTPAVCGLKSSA